MKKIIVFTGSRGIGKSTAAVTVAPPDEIGELIALDTEDSMSDLAGLGFEHVRMYDRLHVSGDMLDMLAQGKVPWVDERGRNALVKYYEYLVKVLSSKLEPGKYKYLVIDTIEPIEAAMTAAVESGRRVFGWSGTRAYGRMETEGVRPLYEGLLEAIAQRGIETIVITSHLKNVWIDDKPVPGKIKPGGRMRVLTRLSSAMFWLAPGDDPSGAPAALVLKARMGSINVTDGQWDIRRVLPERIPAFTWDAVKGYKRQPADLANPADGERMSESERQMISDLLTDKQMELMIASAEQKAAERQPSGMLVKPAETVDVMAGVDGRDKVVGLIEAGKSNAEIVKEAGMPLPQVIKIRGES